MKMKRRTFLISSIATTAAIGVRQMFAVTPGTVTGTPRLKFGVLSDTHLDCNTRAWFRTALEWYREQGIDALIIAGDMTNYGCFSELMYTAQEWERAFPNDKAPDGRSVTKLFCYGNHCVLPESDWHRKQYPDPAERQKNVVALDPKGAWERAFHEAYAPVYSKTVNGYQFVGVHWTGHNAREAWFDAHAKEIDPSKPFFYFQHPHPKDTCYGKWAWGHDDGTSTRILSQFPNAIAFSGHSHFPLTNEETIWQGAFTSIGTSSLNYSGTCDYCNASNGANHHQGRQGMLVTVCDDHVRIERHEFFTNQSLGDDWILPIGKGATKPYEYATRIVKRVAPEFKAGTMAKVELVLPKPDKDGKTPPPSQLKVTFPAAESREKCRAYNYDVEAFVEEVTDGKPLKKWRTHATDYHLPPSKAGGECACFIRLADLPKKTGVRFVIHPVECFGKMGAAISTPVFTTPD
ncbi:MAG: metallophosphoesterase [Planctomycetia bacterium]|nr:metallophosphoesterase [Planctomycetia bacterium]